jgi:single-strand DNA-binding protein
MYQKLVIVGRLGRDPEQRFTKEGKQVTFFSVAVDEGNDKTTWFKVTTWEKLAETCATYLTKGKMVLAEGRVSASAWKGQDGEAKATLELTAGLVKFLSAKEGDAFRVEQEDF